MAKKEVSPIDTFGEEFGATFLGKRIINQAATPSLAVTTMQAVRFIGGFWLFRLVAYAAGWTDVSPFDNLLGSEGGN